MSGIPSGYSYGENVVRQVARRYAALASSSFRFDTEPQTPRLEHENGPGSGGLKGHLCNLGDRDPSSIDWVARSHSASTSTSSGPRVSMAFSSSGRFIPSTVEEDLSTCRARAFRWTRAWRRIRSTKSREIGEHLMGRAAKGGSTQPCSKRWMLPCRPKCRHPVQSKPLLAWSSS